MKSWSPYGALHVTSTGLQIKILFSILANNLIANMFDYLPNPTNKNDACGW